MNDDDVIELGADGSFDIPSPEKPAPAMVAVSSSTRKASLAKPANIPAQEILGLVDAGEYKMFSNAGSKEVHLVINLEGFPNFTDVKVSCSDIVIGFQNEKSLKVSIADYNIDSSTVLATSWNHYLTFRFFKNSQ
jgi:hypothetical protein